MTEISWDSCQKVLLNLLKRKYLLSTETKEFSLKITHIKWNFLLKHPLYPLPQSLNNLNKIPNPFKTESNAQPKHKSIILSPTQPLFLITNLIPSQRVSSDKSFRMTLPITPDPVWGSWLQRVKNRIGCSSCSSLL